MNYNFVPMSEDSAIKETGLTFPHVMISITEPDRIIEFKENEFRKDILRLQFDDIDIPTEPYQLFTKEQAIEIFEFFDKNKDIKDFVIHCYAGLSRSAAVCAALAKIYNGNDSWYFSKRIPNKYVYRTMLEYYYEKENTNE